MATGFRYEYAPRIRYKMRAVRRRCRIVGIDSFNLSGECFAIDGRGEQCVCVTQLVDDQLRARNRGSLTYLYMP
jgi:hypothetical protein